MSAATGAAGKDSISFFYRAVFNFRGIRNKKTCSEIFYLLFDAKNCTMNS